MTDVYAYWRACVKAGNKRPAEAVDLMLPTIGATIAGENPQAGLWKVRPRKDAAHILMHVWLVDDRNQVEHTWRDGLQLAGFLGKASADSQAIVDRWLYVLPATKEEAQHWRAHGRWPTDPEPLPARNEPDDPYERLTAEVQDRLAQVAEWVTVNAPVTDQVNCDKARNMQAAVLELLKRADGMHDAEKRPHLEAGRAADNRYRFRDDLKEAAARLRAQFETFLRAEERRRQEAGMAEPVRAGGGLGRRAGLKDAQEFEIVEYKLAALHVLEQPDVVAAVGKAIARLVRANKGRVDIPGVKINHVRKVA